jgi:hypothetical protein
MSFPLSHSSASAQFPVLRMEASNSADAGEQDICEITSPISVSKEAAACGLSLEAQSKPTSASPQLHVRPANDHLHA